MPKVAMKSLLANFSIFTEAIGGLNELRRVILTLAIQGQLEPQNLNEVGVGVALSKIREQKGAVLKVRGSQLQRMPAIREFPFDPPPNWEFARIDDTGEYINGCTFQSSAHGSVGLPIVRIQNLTNPAATFNYTNRELDSKNIAEAGDVLVSWSATLDAFIWTGTRAAVNQHIFKVEPNEEIVNTRFLFLVLKWAVRNLANSDALHGSAMKHINRGNFISTVVPLPPLAEQQRIVAKVDELMALCDQLEGQLESRNALATKFARSITASEYL